jgi:hypothetical protein
MQEQKTNLEKIINTSIDEIRQKMLTICENGYKSDLDYNSAISSASTESWFRLKHWLCMEL